MIMTTATINASRIGYRKAPPCRRAGIAKRLRAPLVNPLDKRLYLLSFGIVVVGDFCAALKVL